MKETLQYRGFIGSIEVCLEDRCLCGELQFINDLVTYEGETVDELQVSFQSAVDGYLQMCEELEEQPERPFKGSFNVRIGPELHRHAALAAYQGDISLNEFIVNAVKSFLGSEHVKEVHHVVHYEPAEFVVQGISGIDVLTEDADISSWEMSPFLGWPKSTKAKKGHVPWALPLQKS